MTERTIVIPGEVIKEGEDLLPGENTKKEDNKVIALRYGLAEEQGDLIKVISLSGIYNPRRGNVVIGQVENMTMNGWLIDIGSSQTAFLPLTEVPRFVHKNNLEEVMGIGDTVVVKIFSISKRGIDLSIRSRGLGRVEKGLIFKIVPQKIPRIIGKEGSMIKLIRDKTGCEITAGQNGYILVEGKDLDSELYAKEAILFVAEKSYVSGLTEEVEKFFGEKKE